MAFFEVEFPRAIGFHRLGSTSGFLTTVNQGLSGQEQRNQNWAMSRGKWTVSVTTPSDEQRGDTTREDFVQVLLAFHLNCAGKASSFRLYDHIDNSFTDQVIGTGAGAFQLTKSYVIGGRTYVRKIYKPVWSTVTDYLGNALPASVTVKFNGTPVAEGSGWTIDATTGLITSTAGGGVVVTASGTFHLPVRFDVDDLPVRVMESDVHGGNPVITIDSCPLVETLPPNF